MTCGLPLDIDIDPNSNGLPGIGEAEELGVPVLDEAGMLALLSGTGA